MEYAPVSETGAHMSVRVRVSPLAPYLNIASGGVAKLAVEGWPKGRCAHRIGPGSDLQTPCRRRRGSVRSAVVRDHGPNAYQHLPRDAESPYRRTRTGRSSASRRAISCVPHRAWWLNIKVPISPRWWPARCCPMNPSSSLAGPWPRRATPSRSTIRTAQNSAFLAAALAVKADTRLNSPKVKYFRSVREYHYGRYQSRI